MPVNDPNGIYNQNFTESYDDKKISGSGKYNLESLPQEDFDLMDDFEDGSVASKDTSAMNA